MLESNPVLDGVGVKLTLGEVALCGKAAASPLALTIKPKTHTLLLVDHMQYFDVLVSCNWFGAGVKSWYYVFTVKASSEAAARAIAKGRADRSFRDNGRTLLSVIVQGVGVPGTYDGFVGKYVGQFIDEALCRK